MTEETDTQESVSIFAFLVNSPPGKTELINPFLAAGANWQQFIDAMPDIPLYCDGFLCEGERVFFTSPDDNSRDGRHSIARGYVLVVTYRCRNCMVSTKTFTIHCEALPRKDKAMKAVKIGEWPPFGPHTPPRLLRLIQESSDAFLKGRRAEVQNLGIGALTYYRRVVENQKDQLYDAIIKVAEKLDSPKLMIESLVRSKEQWQFKQAMDDLKDAIPDAFRIGGHNPMALLHNALSEGVHDLSDEECLHRAQDARLVLTALAERLATLSKDDSELKAAVGRLAQKKRSKKK